MVMIVTKILTLRSVLSLKKTHNLSKAGFVSGLTWKGKR